MANVTLWGASYTDVPAVTLPQTGGGTVTFYENGGGGGYTAEDILTGAAPSGEIAMAATSKLPTYAISGRNAITQLTITFAANVTTADTYTITQNSGLDKLILKKSSGGVIPSANYFISNNTGLKELDMRDFSGSLSPNSLRNNTALQIADIGAPTSIAVTTFYADAALKTLIIRSTSIPSLANVNAFQNTPYYSNGSGGTIYIPKSLYDHLGDGTANDYKAATNWSTLDGYGHTTWAKIEGSIYE